MPDSYMPNEQLELYIAQSRNAGKTDADIFSELTAAGWDKKILDLYLHEAVAPQQNEIDPSPTTQLENFKVIEGPDESGAARWIVFLLVTAGILLFAAGLYFLLSSLFQ